MVPFAVRLRSSERCRARRPAFAENEAYFLRAEKAPLAAILWSAPFRPPEKVVIQVPNARVAFCKVLRFSSRPVFAAGDDPSP